MPANVVNVLAALVAAPPAQASDSSASANTADDNAQAQGQQFSQMLNDSGKQSNGQSAGQQLLSAKIMQAFSTTNVVSAQEVTTPAEQIAQLLAQREQIVTPADAKELIKRVDAAISQHTSVNDTKALTQIKVQLQTIIKTSTPASIAQILQAAPAVKDAKLPLSGLTALLTSKKAVTADALDSSAHNEKESAAVTTQTVPVVIFRPDAGETKTTPHPAKSDTKKEAVNKPAIATAEAPSPSAPALVNPAPTVDAAAAAMTLAAGIVPPVIQPIITAPTVVSTATGLTNISDIRITDTMPQSASKPRLDLDEVIPPLTANAGTDAEQALPAVNLPKTASVQADSFKALADAAALTLDATKADVKPVHAPTDLSSVNNLSQPAGSIATQTVHAVQPVAVIQTPGLINHAPVTEQVSVAVNKAQKDGISTITIQLDPMGLGRVEVHMRTNHEGQTQISFIVDKADTFDNLSRDARSLERSLQEAGIKADTGSMQFNMRQQQQPQMHSDLNQGGQHAQHQASQEDTGKSSTTGVASISAPALNRNYIVNVREGVDISA